MQQSYSPFSLQLDDVNDAYSHDEIRYEEKHEELLNKFGTERTQDKERYEVIVNNLLPLSSNNITYICYLIPTESHAFKGDREI